MNEFKDNPENEDQNPENNVPDNSASPQKQINPIISPIAAAILGLVGAFVLYQIVGGIITLLIFGKDLKTAPVNALRLLTAGGQILFILLPALVFAKWIYEDVSTIIRFKLPDWKEFALFTLGIVILTPLLQNYLYIQNYIVAYLAKISPFFQNIKSALDSLDKMIENTYGDLLSTNNFLEGIFVVVIVSIVPAICEETMFRGFIQKSFEFKLKPFWAALITAIFFGLYHFNPYGLIPLIGLGFYFGFAAYTSNSIFIPMTLHFLNNFAAIILYFVFGNDELINSTVESKADLNSTIISFVLLLIVFSGVIVFIKRYYSQVKNI
ncbi:MAG: CPBP family intramembrane metalloprotease [Ignavibacteriaceae bacterium]|jgi:membrane protease YdiL (CAAX protease family)